MQSINDTYQRITDTIVKQLEAGTKPWIRPWRNDIRCSLTPRRATGEAYRGINVLMLWISSQIFGYEENTWMTYRQAQDLGAKVRKGEKGTLVVKYGTFTPKEREDDEDCSIPYLKGYTVLPAELRRHSDAGPAPVRQRGPSIFDLAPRNWPLCRKPDYAAWPIIKAAAPPFGHAAVRHNQSDSRNTSSSSLGRYRPGWASGLAT